MALPKKIKNDIDIRKKNVLLDRRKELLENIQKDGTYLPKSIEHADLDRGMLDFVRDSLEVTVEGNKVPVIDKIITAQNWAQFVTTWDFVNLDKNIKPPFITTIRNPEVKYGTNPSLQYTIPNRKQFYYAKVPTWDGQRKGMDIYKIPQPVPIDIIYNVKIFCNKMRHLNAFNKKIMQTFTSRQAYTFVKGHYIPIVLENISDESNFELEKRKYYVQNYEFMMMGFIMDEDEFEIKPAITRQLTLFEFDSANTSRKVEIKPENPDTYDIDVLFVSGITELSEEYFLDMDLKILSTDNIISYSIYVNNNLVGDDISEILITSNDILKINITKIDNSQSATIKIKSTIN